MSQKTLLLIKPDAVERNLIGKIIDRVEASGFKIGGLKMVSPSQEQARRFYAVHQGKPFLDDLVAFMASGAIVALSLERSNAVAALRELIGATDPEHAACGTIRQCFGVDVTRNSVHASDSLDNAGVELDFFFKDN